MKQAKSFQPIPQKLYTSFEIEQNQRKKAKFRRSHNLDVFTVPDSESFLFGHDLDAAIDEMTATWEV